MNAEVAMSRSRRKVCTWTSSIYTKLKLISLSVCRRCKLLTSTWAWLRLPRLCSFHLVITFLLDYFSLFLSISMCMFKIRKLSKNKNKNSVFAFFSLLGNIIIYKAEFFWKFPFKYVLVGFICCELVSRMIMLYFYFILYYPVLRKILLVSFNF